MSVPFLANASYSGPVSREIVATGSATSTSSASFALVGAGTKSIDFGTVVMAKLLVVHVPREGNTAPVVVRIDGALTGQEISPGGFISIASPNPTAGITSADIDYTVDSLVHCDILG